MRKEWVLRKEKIQEKLKPWMYMIETPILYNLLPLRFLKK